MATFDSLDINSDGVIDREEWVAAVSKPPPTAAAEEQPAVSVPPSEPWAEGTGDEWGQPRFHSVADTANAVEVPRALNDARRPRGEASTVRKTSYTPSPKKNIKDATFAAKKPPQA